MLIVSILVFCIVLFLYLHIYFHLKRSNDLEVYQIDQPSKERLEEVCDIRQPTTFEFNNEQLLNAVSYRAIVQNFRAFDVQIRDVQQTVSALDESELYIPVTLKVANEAFQNDTNSTYISENNADFIEETGLIKIFQLNDEFLRPYMVSNCVYDIMLGSASAATPLRYEVNYRNYFLVSQGKIKILLIPPKDGKYLYPIEDYDNFEFRSQVNAWKVQTEYQNDFDKLKTLEVELTQGSIMYIPAFWWYSIKFMEAETSICSFKYRTYMNSISILPKLIMKVLQNHNTKRDTIQKRVFIPIRPKSSTECKSCNDTTPVNNTITENNQKTQEDIITISSTQTPLQFGDQFLPASLRNNNNPFTMQTPNGSDTQSLVVSSAPSIGTATMNPASSSSAHSSYNPSQKEVIIL
jgi:hypothetical protein